MLRSRFLWLLAAGPTVAVLLDSLLLRVSALQSIALATLTLASTALPACRLVRSLRTMTAEAEALAHGGRGQRLHGGDLEELQPLGQRLQPHGRRP